MTRQTRPERRLMESSYRESPADRPSFALEAIVPTLLATGAVYVLASTLSDVTDTPRFWAAVTCLVVGAWRVVRWDTEGRAVNIIEHTKYVPEPESRERPIVASRDRHVIMVGRWAFTPSELRQIGGVLATGKVTRAALSDLLADDGDALFANITERYPGIAREFQRLEWIDDDKATTDIAREWFERHGIPLS